MSLEPAPDGGWMAWLQVVGAHLVNFNTWGFINSFGFFQSYYVTALGESESTVSWIGSIQIFLLFFIGTISGRSMDAGYFRATIAIGCFLQVFGAFMTSLSTKYWQVFLAQGVCMGLGDGMLFAPAVALISTYFTTKRAVAVAAIVSGSASGGMVFPVIARQLLPQLGFGWTVRVMAFVMLFNAAFALAVLRQRTPPRKAGPWIEWDAFREPLWLLVTAASFFCIGAIYVPYFFLTPFSHDQIHVSSANSLTILLVLNAVGIPGRLIPGYLADRYFGKLMTIAPLGIAAAIVLYCWAGVSTLPGLIPYVCIYGSLGAGTQGLMPSTIASLTTDPRKMGVRLGMALSFMGIAALVSQPIAGALIKANNGNYLYAQMFAGSLMMVGSLFYFAAALFQRKMDKKSQRMSIEQEVEEQRADEIGDESKEKTRPNSPAQSNQ
ncbi:MFS general substrate transporter [Xylona heveae TC161]|uniref:MFS general substrate transporter n=1 Tax=Xylona heveae (strain CBS 132557 / TC161) TaxID=1328760 RepID=A0A165JKB9_XYLHT|nr:MFS general substrate transporter [Xylona heveae TC161]KZF26343.1 MFS general substrate transporter [Xylona heveae TC161]